MPHRFYCPQLVETGSVVLDETEAHHIAHVLRHKVDDIVELFNGAGLVASCQITAIRKRDVAFNVLASRIDPPPAKTLTLATAAPKGDRFDWMIEKATELGVSRIVPIVTQRSIVDPRDSKLEKLRQTVITACKQSGRNHLMEILPVVSWADLLPVAASDQQILIAHPPDESGGSNWMASLSEIRPVMAVIGPEGGFTDGEIQTAKAAGAKAVCLGPYILRIETAALSLAAKLLH